MNSFTPAELALIQSLLHHYRIQMVAALKRPPLTSPLTPAGRQQYEHDAALALSALDKLMQAVAA